MKKSAEHKDFPSKFTRIPEEKKDSLIQEFLREEFENDLKRVFGSEVDKKVVEDMVNAAMTP